MTQLRIAVMRANTIGSLQQIAVVGTQGTGKTRLLTELEAELLAETEGGAPQVRVVVGRAREGDTSSSVIGSLLRSRFELDELDEPAARSKLIAGVREVMGTDAVGEMLHYLGVLVGIEFEASQFVRVLGEDPGQHGEVARAVVRRLFEADAARLPLVMFVDDLHHADLEGVNFLQSLAAGLSRARITLVTTFLPELLLRTQLSRDVESLELRNLEPDDAEAMFRGLLANCDGVTNELAEEAVGQTGGNPYFLEQLVRLFIDQGIVNTKGPRWDIDAERALSTGLPISIEQAVEARIAELERDERILLEQGAVFGNVFWLSAVVAMHRIATPTSGVVDLPVEVWGDGEPIRQRLARIVSDLAERDYLLPLDVEDSAFPGNIEIVFKHNLEREFVVRATEPARLARYHRLAAQWLEARATRSDEQLEFIAGLYERGGEPGRAARCYLDGARRARSRDALVEARQLYARALGQLSDGDADAPARMEVLHDLGDVLDKAGHGALAEEQFVALLELAWRFDHPGKAGAAYIRLARLRRRAGLLPEAVDYLQRAAVLHDRGHDDAGRAAVLDEFGRIATLRGELDEALSQHQAALAIRRKLAEPRSIALSLAHIGRTLHERGDAKSATAPLMEALELRRSIGDRLGLAQSLADLSDAHLSAGDSAMARQLAQDSQGEAEAIGDRVALAEALLRVGSAEAALGNNSDAMAALETAQGLARETGDRANAADATRRLAEVLVQVGQLESARAAALAAVAESESLGARASLGRSLRVLAEAAIAAGQNGEAEQALMRAVEVQRAVGHHADLVKTMLVFAHHRRVLGDSAGAAKWTTEANSLLIRGRSLG